MWAPTPLCLTHPPGLLGYTKSSILNSKGGRTEGVATLILSSEWQEGLFTMRTRTHRAASDEETPTSVSKVNSAVFILWDMVCCVYNMWRADITLCTLYYMHYIKCITYYITSVTFNFFFSTLHYITLPIIHYITLHAIHYNTFLFSLAGCLSPAESPALTPGSMCRISQSITHKFPAASTAEPVLLWCVQFSKGSHSPQLPAAVTLY